ncbi:reticulocyte-binding protein homolog 2a-like [Clytia hemisphaerica]|uniref:reticulocyte-binding protein homolog 2a-like n=1 Tax=Clytia hemisphaerica TaxID=252671 RepID=UPI0034D5E287
MPKVAEGSVSNKYFVPKFFRYLRGLLNQVTIWSNLLTGNLVRYSKSYDLDLTSNSKTQLSSEEVTNSYAELYFHLKKSDQTKKNLPLGQFIVNNKKFCLAIKRQFVDKMTKKEFIDKGRDQTTFLRKSLNTDVELDKKPTKIEEETWMQSKKPQSRKKRGSLLKSPNKPIHFKPNSRSLKNIADIAKERKILFTDILKFTLHNMPNDSTNIDSIFFYGFNCLSDTEKEAYGSLTLIDLNTVQKANTLNEVDLRPTSKRGITNSNNICYVNTVLQLLLGSCIKPYLPLYKSSNPKLCRILEFVSDELSKNVDTAFEFTSPFIQSSENYQDVTELAIPEVLKISMGKDYRRSEENDAEEFLDSLLDCIYPNQEKNESPFNCKLAEYFKCKVCGTIKGWFHCLNYLRVSITEGEAKTNMLPMLQKGLLDNPNSKLLCCEKSSPLQATFLVNSPTFLLVATNRSAHDRYVVNRKVEIEQELNISSIRGIDEDNTYKLIGTINFISPETSTGHYICYLLDGEDILKFNDSTVTVQDKTATLNDDTFQETTHVLCYMKQSKNEVFISQAECTFVNDVLLGTNISKSEFVSRNSIENCIFGRLNDEIINAFLSSFEMDIVTFPTQWFYDASKNKKTKSRKRFENDFFTTDSNKDCFIPINKNNHWYLVFLNNGLAVYFDSLMEPVDEEITDLVETLQNRKNNEELNWLQLKGRKQQNNVDCGIHILSTAWDLSNREEKARLTNVKLLRYWIASCCGSNKKPLQKTKHNKMERGMYNHNPKQEKNAEKEKIRSVDVADLMTALKQQTDKGKDFTNCTNEKQETEEYREEIEVMQRDKELKGREQRGKQEQEQKEHPEEDRNKNEDIGNEKESEITWKIKDAHTRQMKVPSVERERFNHKRLAPKKDIESIVQDIKKRKLAEEKDTTKLGKHRK